MIYSRIIKATPCSCNIIPKSDGDFKRFVKFYKTKSVIDVRNYHAVVHIKDFKVEENKLVSVAAGMGEMDYSEIIRFIKARKPYIHVTLENTVPENAVESREYIQRLWDESEV